MSNVIHSHLATGLSVSANDTFSNDNDCSKPSRHPKLGGLERRRAMDPAQTRARDLCRELGRHDGSFDE